MSLSFWSALMVHMCLLLTLDYSPRGISLLCGRMRACSVQRLNCKNSKIDLARSRMSAEGWFTGI